MRLVFLLLPDAETAIARVAARVAQGEHFIPEDVVRRRFTAGLRNFHAVYKKPADGWILYDNIGEYPLELAAGEKHV